MKNRKLPILVPEIRLLGGMLLQNVIMSHRRMIPKFRNEKEPTWKQLELSTKKNRILWRKTEKKVLTAMQKVTGLNFYQNIIDVHIVYGIKGAFSLPLIMSSELKGDYFVDVLTHELLHRLIVDNKQKIDGTKWVQKKYPKIKDRIIINHILVHAIHKEIYINVLKKKDRLKADIQNCQKWPAYKSAWDIVEKDDHSTIIHFFRKSHGI